MGWVSQKIDEIGSDRLKDPLSYISNFLSIPKAHEISKIISKLDEKKSSHGIISNKVLKVINETISPYLEILFHKCIISGVFPDCFKIAEVIPLFKGGEKEDTNCYRPISLLPTISKIFERVLATRLISFFYQIQCTCHLVILIKALAHVQYSWIWLRRLIQ